MLKGTPNVSKCFCPQRTFSASLDGSFRKSLVPFVSRTKWRACRPVQESQTADGTGRQWLASIRNSGEHDIFLHVEGLDAKSGTRQPSGQADPWLHDGYVVGIRPIGGKYRTWRLRWVSLIRRNRVRDPAGRAGSPSARRFCLPMASNGPTGYPGGISFVAKSSIVCSSTKRPSIGRQRSRSSNSRRAASKI